MVEVASGKTGRKRAVLHIHRIAQRRRSQRIYLEASTYRNAGDYFAGDDDTYGNFDEYEDEEFLLVYNDILVMGTADDADPVYVSNITAIGQHDIAVVRVKNADGYGSYDSPFFCR